MSIKRGLAAALLSVAVGGALAVASAAPAAAGENFNGTCDAGEVCLYDNVGFTGSAADFYNAVSNYGGWHFYNSPYWLANNVESAKNKATWSCVNFFDNANYSGVMPEQLALVAGGESGNFGRGNNRAESHNWTNTFPYQCK